MAEGAAFFTPIAKGAGGLVSANGLQQSPVFSNGLLQALGQGSGETGDIFASLLAGETGGEQASNDINFKDAELNILQLIKDGDIDGLEAIFAQFNEQQIVQLLQNKDGTPTQIGAAILNSQIINQTDFPANSPLAAAKANLQIQQSLKENGISFDGKNDAPSDEKSKEASALLKETKNIVPKELTASKQGVSFDLNKNAPASLSKQDISNAFPEIATSEKIASSIEALGAPSSAEKTLASALQRENTSFAVVNSTVASSQSSAAANSSSAQTGATYPASQTLAAIMQKTVDGGTAKQFTLQLDPPELGRVDVKISFGKDKTVKAVLTIERSDTYAMLQKDSQFLERSLQGTGLDAKAGLEFSLANKEHDFNQNFNGDNKDGEASSAGGGAIKVSSASGEDKQVWITTDSYSLVV